MTLQSIVWDDFSGGDYGDRGGWDAPKGTWSGINMKVDRDGSICPRKGAVDLAPTGLGAGATDVHHLSAVVRQDGLRIWVLFGSTTTELRSKGLEAEVGTGQAWINYTNEFPWPLYSSHPAVVDDESESHFGNADPAGLINVLIKANHDTPALTQVASGGASVRTWLVALATYGDRMFSVSDAAGKRNRITFSNAPDDVTNAYDYGSLPAGNYIDVGAASDIRRLQRWRDALLIFKPTEVWAFRGNPVGNASLRPIGRMSVRTRLAGGRNYAVADDQTLWIAGDGKRPVVFDGVKCVFVDHIDLGRTWKHQVVAMNNGQGGVVYYEGLDKHYDSTTPGYDWVWTGQRWLRWRLTRPTASLLQTDTGGTGPIPYPRSAVVQRAFGEAHLFWAEKQNNGGTVTVPMYRLNLGGDGPGLANSPYELPGDGSTTALAAQFSLPYYVPPDRQQARVTKVVVRGKRYRTGGASTNHFDIAINAKHRFRDAADAASATQSWDETNASAGAATGDWSTFEAEFSFLAPAGQAAEVAFTNVRGVGITSVVADVDVAGRPG
jgi:hypothetical protein